MVCPKSKLLISNVPVLCASKDIFTLKCDFITSVPIYLLICYKLCCVMIVFLFTKCHNLL